MTPREALLAMVQNLPPDEPVVVPAGWIQALLVTEISPVNVDLSGAAVAERLGRSPVTISSWCRLGMFPGCYRLRGREWRIPAAALETFQRGQRGEA